MTRLIKARGKLAELLSQNKGKDLSKTKNKMLLAAKLCAALRSKGITQKAFAEIMGKTESEISDWLSGERNFTVDTLTEIEQVLGISLLNTQSMNVCQVPRNAVKTNVLSSLTMVCTSAERVALVGGKQIVTNTKLKVG
jgi:DNA-binding helix-turn-helix protein